MGVVIIVLVVADSEIQEKQGGYQLYLIFRCDFCLAPQPFLLFMVARCSLLAGSRGASVYGRRDRAMQAGQGYGDVQVAALSLCVRNPSGWRWNSARRVGKGNVWVT